MLTILVTFLMSPTAQAAIPSLDSSWKCQMESYKYSCSRTKNDKRAVVNSEAKIAKDNQMELDRAVLSEAMPETTVLQPVQETKVGELVWLEKIQQMKDSPVPTMILYTIKGQTAYKYFVMADKSELEAIKTEIQDAVAKSK